MANKGNQLHELLGYSSKRNNGNGSQDRRQIELLNRHSATIHGVNQLLELVSKLTSEIEEINKRQSASVEQQSMTNRVLTSMEESLAHHSERTSAHMEMIADLTKNGLSKLMNNGLSVRNKCLPPRSTYEYMNCLKDFIVILMSVYYFIGYIYFKVCSLVLHVTKSVISRIPFLHYVLIPLVEMALLLIMFWIGTVMGQLGTFNMIHRETIGALAIKVVKIICYKSAHLLKSSIIYISDDLVSVYEKAGLYDDVQLVKNFAFNHLPRIEMLENLKALTNYTILPNSSQLYHSSGLASTFSSSSILFKQAGQIVSKSATPILSKTNKHLNIAEQIFKENGKEALESASSIIENGISNAMAFLSSQLGSASNTATALTGGSVNVSLKSVSPHSKRPKSKSTTSNSTYHNRKTYRKITSNNNTRKRNKEEWNEVNQYLAKESIQDSANILIVLLSTILDLSKLYSSLSDEGRDILNVLIDKKYKNTFSLDEIYRFQCLGHLQGYFKTKFFSVYDKIENVSFIM